MITIPDPQDPVFYNNRGISYKEKGELDRALKDFNKALELNPDFAEAYNNRGIAYGIKGQVDEAIEDASKAIALDKNVPMLITTVQRLGYA